MNKILKAATGIAMLMGTSAHALPTIDTSKIYLGLTYITDESEVDVEKITGTSPVLDNKVDGFGAFVGYQFNDLIGLELSYKDFGDTSIEYTNTDGTKAKGTNEYQHGALSAVIGHNITPNVRIFGKVGYGALYTEESVTDNNSTLAAGMSKFDESGSNFGENYGVGVAFVADNGFAIRAEYEVLPDNDGANPDAIDNFTQGGMTNIDQPELFTISVSKSF
jgi:opacity protein-like surface antigen